MSRNFAVVCADRDRRRLIEDALTSVGDRCTGFAKGAAFLKALNREAFDLAWIDDVELVRRIRSGVEAPGLPIILATTGGDEVVIAGLNAGADDVIAGPMHEGVVRARAAAVIRRALPAPPSDMEAFGEACFDLRREAVTIRREQPALTAKEFGLALVLFRNLHRPLSRAYLLEAVWGRSDGSPSRTLDTHIYRLRVKLKLTPEHGFRLGPVHGHGYRLERVTGPAEKPPPTAA